MFIPLRISVTAVLSSLLYHLVLIVLEATAI